MLTNQKFKTKDAEETQGKGSILAWIDWKWIATIPRYYHHDGDCETSWIQLSLNHENAFSKQFNKKCNEY